MFSLIDALIVRPIVNILFVIYDLVGDFGLAIIIFVVIVKLATWPLIKKQMHQTRIMRQIQPELAEIKKNVCGDFIWSLYGVGDKYYPDIADHMLAKIVYLLTYLDYDRNILVVRDSVTSAYRPMKKADVKNIIRLHSHIFFLSGSGKVPGYKPHRHASDPAGAPHF